MTQSDLFCALGLGSLVSTLKAGGLIWGTAQTGNRKRFADRLSTESLRQLGNTCLRRIFREARGMGGLADQRYRFRELQISSDADGFLGQQATVIRGTSF